MAPHVTVDICTKDRYTSTLPLAMMSVATQTRLPNHVVIYDDSINRVDMRNIESILHILKLFTAKGITWEVVYGPGMGQHIGHQLIQGMAQEYVWRIDDDEFAESNVLEELLKQMGEGVGAVGGLVLMTDAIEKDCAPNRIDNLHDNCQWYKWKGVKPVEHLYSSYLYKKGLHRYETTLSPVAHREETLHSYGMFRKGQKLFVTGSAITWHLRASTGGIRVSQNPEHFHWDEMTFREVMREYEGKIVCYLDSGKGDHIVFKTILPKIKEKYKEVTLAVCWPDIFPEENTISLAEGQKLCNPIKHNISKFCIDNKWKDELKFAYAKMYGVEI